MSQFLETSEIHNYYYDVDDITVDLLQKRLVCVLNSVSMYIQLYIFSGHHVGMQLMGM